MNLVARAVNLRSQGLLYREIARELHISKTTAIRLCDPGYAERHRANARAWKDAHREQNRARDRQYQQDIKDPCPHCGTAKSPEWAQCSSCREAAIAVRRTLAEGMWADGWLTREITEALGMDHGQLAPMRAHGWDLPHRYRVENGQREGAPAAMADATGAQAT
jgi:hypothetical protein